jgi:hypothetical protein
MEVNRRRILEKIVEKGGLYGSCAELYLNDRVKGSFYISECFEQCHLQSSIDHWGIELVLEIINFRLEMVRHSFRKYCVQIEKKISLLNDMKMG